MTNDPRRYAPAAQRNREAILQTLPHHLPTAGRVLEIASGSGEHACFLTPQLPETLTWAPSDLEAAALPGIDAHAAESGCARIEPARRVDVTAPQWWAELPEIAAIFCANMIHIAPWEAACGLITGAGALLAPGGTLALYGPYRRDGDHTAPSNLQFDDWLKGQDPRWGVRDLEGEVLPEAEAVGLRLKVAEPMPANNFIIVLTKEAAAS